ncbi:hypothetical protein GCM10007176_16060 [Salinicoccus roseus]|nr:hypothetical protein GCM10007176_16060 [Salinicoccus roseus]
MPATYVENDDEAKSLEISLYGKLIDAELKLLYTVYEKFNVITRSAKFINHGEENINLSRVLSASVDFLDSDFEMIQLSGAWSRERHGHSRKLAPGIQRISSKRGDDKTSLGDWFVDERKLPNGITTLAEKITAMGLDFGLWFEPEMVSKVSESYKTHPD